MDAIAEARNLVGDSDEADEVYVSLIISLQHAR